jgi:APA family basic amino acid/polyamine antiporter
VRGWSVRDAVIYACLATNIVTLGWYEMAYQSAFPRGQILTSILISGVWVSFLVLAYAGLIVTIPRAGGDYVWQSRILGGPVGFVFAVTGWWFILWLWAPIYGNILNVEFFQPILATAGATGAATWFGTHSGIFVASVITVALAGVLVSLGMSGYARVQKWCFAGGLVGFGAIVIILLAASHTSFVNSFNREAYSIFGLKGAYQATVATGAKLGYHAPAFGLGPVGPSMLLVPMMMFYLLWPNWGSTLYGEIRGANDFRRSFLGMFLGLWLTIGLSVLFLLVVEKTIGYQFWETANANWFAGKNVLPIWPYPAMLAGWLVHSRVFQVVLLLLMSLWFFGWVGSLFLSSTRVIFAAAFDRVLPDGAASVSEKRHVPVWSLVLMLVPAVIVSALYAYWSNFATWTFDATLVIAVTYLFTAFAAFVLPWVKPDLWRSSAASRLKVAAVPIVPAAALITMGLLIFNLVEWLSKSGYGVNNTGSLIFMGILYVLAVGLYVVARVVRRRQGIDLGLINREIPVE